MDFLKEYNIIRRKVKHIRININRDKNVKIIIPMKYPISELNKIIEKRSEWIKEKQRYFDNMKSGYFKMEKNEILYLGREYKFIYKQELGKAIRIDDKKLEISSGLKFSDKNVLLGWQKIEAKNFILKRLQEINKSGRFKYNMVFIRNQKTKWGNCSSKKNLSFNWRLIMTPLFVVDYLIFHELIHLEVMNHSKEYWLRLSLVYPEYKEANKWLKQYGGGLFY